MLTIGVVGIGSSSLTGTAAAVEPTCTPSGTGSGSTCTIEFAYTGAEQSFVVPAGVTTLQVTALGGGGGNGQGERSGGRGGAGALVSGSIPVTPGATLYIEVGGRGEHAPASGSLPPAQGGFNGGGRAGQGGRPAGGGGGASDVRTVTRSGDWAPSLASRLIVAGAGGGGGNRSTEGAGDAGMSSVAVQGGVSAKAGMTTHGGDGGYFPPEGRRPGEDGWWGFGGHGADRNYIEGSGGGGAGLYGGGGGGGGEGRNSGSGMGGAGGSSLVPTNGTLTISTLSPRNGFVRLQYLTDQAAPVVRQDPVPLAVRSGQPGVLQAQAAGSPEPTAQWQRAAPNTEVFTDMPGATRPHLELPPLSTAESGAQYRVVFTNPLGTATSKPATVTVQPEPPRIVTQPVTALVLAGQQATFTVEVAGDPTPTLRWQRAAPGSDQFVDVPGATGASFQTSVLTAADDRTRFRVIATNIAGEMISRDREVQIQNG